MHVALITVAVLFALVNGLNDGGSIVAVGAKVRAWPPLVSAAALGAALVIGPALLTTHVAKTISTGLISFRGTTGEVVLLTSTIAAVLVVATLAVLGLPTSMTLANVGAIAGGGLGAGLPVKASEVFLVFGAGLAAPMIGGLFAALLARLVQGGPYLLSGRSRLLAWHYVGFSGQALAYSINDGQRTIAIFALADGLAPGAIPVRWLVVLGALFAVGAAIGFVRVARTFGSTLVDARPRHQVVAESAAAATAFLASRIGAPVSMTQTVSGGLTAAVGREGWRMVRWQAFSRLAAAWAVTLPSSLAVGAMFGTFGRLV